jgi:arylsulfatase
MEQDGEISPTSPVGVWQTQFTRLRVPNLYDLRADPFERATSSIYYPDWQVRRVFIQVPIQAVVAKWIESFKDFPPRAKAASFTVGDVMEKITTASPHQN